MYHLRGGGGGAGNEATIYMQTTHIHYRLTCQFSSTLILTLMMTQPWPRWTPSLSLTRSLSHVRETSSTSLSLRDRHDGTLSVIDAKVLFVVNNLLFVCYTSRYIKDDRLLLIGLKLSQLPVLSGTRVPLALYVPWSLGTQLRRHH